MILEGLDSFTQFYRDWTPPVEHSLEGWVSANLEKLVILRLEGFENDFCLNRLRFFAFRLKQPFDESVSTEEFQSAFYAMMKEQGWIAKDYEPNDPKNHRSINFKHLTEKQLRNIWDNRAEITDYFEQIGDRVFYKGWDFEPKLKPFNPYPNMSKKEVQNAFWN